MTDQLPPRRFEERWRMSRAGIVNVWHYLDNTFDLSGGRMILRGTNGSGKSRALEMLLPFLLDGDRRRMDATGSGRVSLDELMRTGAAGQTNRTGYLWLELERPDGQFLTIGALIRHSQSAGKTQVWYFTTPLRVGHELILISTNREPLTRDALTELIGPEQLTESAEAHRERVRGSVFGLLGEAGRDRYQGLLQLLHTLRSPDVGNRIDEGRLPQILGDSMPPLGEQILARAGEQLDGLTETRAAQQRLEGALAHVRKFLDVYRRYAASTLLDAARRTLCSTDELQSAEGEARRVSAEHERLQQDFAERRVAEERLRADLQELENAIKGIQAREVFKTADDLVQRDRTVAALAHSADQAMVSAERERGNHARAVDDADRRLGELREAVESAAGALGESRRALHEAALPGGALPGEVHSVDQPITGVPAVLRTTRDGRPKSIPRPQAKRVIVLPADLDGCRLSAESAAGGARERLELAERRLAETRRLAYEEQKVLALESDAAHALDTATRDADEAADATVTRDDVAVTLAVAWRGWTTDPVTADLLGDLDWRQDATIGPLLLDVEALAGDESGDLSVLDRVADTAARAARGLIAGARAELGALEVAAANARTSLEHERSELRRMRDPLPRDAPWLAPDRSGEPLWRSVDFADAVDAADRAGIEGALLAAGLLTATVETDGSVRAADGELLLGPTAARPSKRLSTVLRPDPACGLPSDLIATVLESIGLDDDTAPTSVALDGSWHNGPLRGRHVLPAARHIGAAARAAHRRARLAEIEAALAELDAEAQLRREDVQALDAREDRLDRHLRTAPRSADLHAARRLQAAAAARATASHLEAEQESARARARRTRWAAELSTHRATCAHHGLPAEADALAAVVTAARQAASCCRRFAEDLARLAGCLRRHAGSLTRAGEVAAIRDAAEQEADHRWREWSDLAAEVAARHEAIDLAVEQVRGELDRSQRAFDKTRQQLAEASAEVIRLGPQVGTARALSDSATSRVEQTREAMIATAGWFSRRITLPGVAAAATSVPLGAVERPELIASVRKAAEHVLSTITVPRQAASDNAVLGALQTFDRDVSGQLDVRHTVDDSVQLVEVAGAGDDRTLAGAAAALVHRVEAGRAALSDREREVFTTFVLGGLAEELRRRVNQADLLIKAMNASLRSIRTSNGIGVHLGWRLVDDQAALARILELVATADAVRSPAQNDELTELLRRRVEEFYDSDPTSGYTAHLAAALDYRRWHEVVVTILGPEAEQRRRLSKRAKLSQGETRFVSYVTLFAAADGYLTSLGDNDRALRLILLDDAFAKVDDKTVAELMGLLVRLDLDFVLTGHALWGCFPQVPKLDIYEVRRMDGSSAVTTHVHWDGRNRHLRSTA